MQVSICLFIHLVWQTLILMHVLPGAFHFVHGVDVGGPAGIAAYFRPLMTPAPKSGNRYNIYV